MAEPTIQLGGGNWAGKSGNLLGYYEQNKKFYAEDFTFSRSTTGTYTDSDGYIQEMPYNLLTYSEDFINSSWSKYQASITSGFTSPDGENNAFKLVENSSNDSHILYKNNITTGSGKTTLSIKAKAEERKWILFGDFEQNNRVYFDLENGVAGTVLGSPDSYSITSIENGWYDITLTSTSVTQVDFQVYLATGNNQATYQGDGSSGVYIWGAQVNKGTSAKTYFPTTTRLNMPRVDYKDNTNGSLILEPQRTNLITYSEAIGSNGFNEINSSIQSNVSVSPNGTLNADLLKENTANDTHFMFKDFNLSSGQTYSISVFAKSNGTNRNLRFGDGGLGWSSGFNVNFDLTNGSADSGGVIESYGNGWYRCSVVGTTNATTSRLLVYSILNTSTSYQGDGSSGVFLYGLQVEQGSYPTTLINTSGSSVTRNADACSITNVADRIGQTEGVVYMDFVAQRTDGVSQSHFWLGASGSEIGLYGGSQFIFYSSGGVQINGGNIVNGQRYKVAFGYKANDYVAYINGTQVGTDTSATVPTMSALVLNSYFDGTELQKKDINDFKLYNTKLSNSELAALTT
jgi:hypothetical protein